jgi:hypothetical protein
MDIFNNDAFRVMDMSEAIEIVPNQWGMIGGMGLFTPKPITGDVFSVEMRDGVLQLVNSSERGTSLPSQGRKKRKLKILATERFGLKSRITATDIDKIRAFGKVTELQQVSAEVQERQEDLRGSLDVTREYHRAGALQGIVYDADGSVLMNLFDEFGGPRLTVDFELGSAGTNLLAKCRRVSRHIRTNLKGDVMTGIGCLMHPDFTDKLMGHADFEERYKYFTNANGGDPLRDDESAGFKFGGILFKRRCRRKTEPRLRGVLFLMLRQTSSRSGHARRSVLSTGRLTICRW